MRNKRRFSDKKIVAFVIALLVMLMAILMFWIIYPKLTSMIESVVKKEEIHECVQWQKWSKEIRDLFYLTPWQKEQCDAVGIKIDAPVKGGGQDENGKK